MADISKITLPSGTTYNLKDAEARSQIQALTGGDAVVFIGVSETELTDGGSQTPRVNNVNITPATGQLFFYGTEQFVWGPDNKWHGLGSLDSLGSLAYKSSASGSYLPEGNISQPTFTGSESSVTITATDNASGNYQPKGSVSQPTFTGSNSTFTGTFTPHGTVTVTTKTLSSKTAVVTEAESGEATYTPGGSVGTPTISVKTAGSTTTIKNPTSVTVAKSVVAVAPNSETPAPNAVTYYDVTNQNLRLYQLGYTTGASITTSNVTVKNGDAAYQSSQPSFTGTGVRLVTGGISVPNTYQATWSGIENNVSVSGIPYGDVSKPTFTGTKAQISGTTTAQGRVSRPTFTGTSKTVTVS